jgi:hypothetical protein
MLVVVLLPTPGLSAPAHAFFSAMPGPLTPLQQRPWRQQRHLDEEQFKVTHPSHLLVMCTPQLAPQVSMACFCNPHCPSSVVRPL